VTARRPFIRVCDRLARSVGRLAHGRGEATAFGLRLSVSILLTFAVIGFAGYLLISDQLEQRLLATYADETAADARSFERVARRSHAGEPLFTELGELIDGFASPRERARSRSSTATWPSRWPATSTWSTAF
jgi:hypothetical protein